MVTTDEPIWLARSGNFYRAIRSGDFIHTYQMAQPGVMTMWAGAVAYWIKAPEFATFQTTNLDDVYSFEKVLRANGIDPLSMMVAAKVSKVLLQSLFFAIGTAFLFRLVRPRVAWLASGLIILSPFLTGFDFILHVDGLFTTICFAALLSIVYASLHSPLQGSFESGIGWWIVAGALSACAWLTRSTGVLLIGVAGLSLLHELHAVRGGTWFPGWRSVWSAAVRLFLWLMAGALTTVLLLPALWVDPGGVLSKLWSWSSNAASEGHENPTFFMGEIHQGNPGWAVYPIVTVWRTTPVEWFGVLAFVILLPWMLRRRSLSKDSLRLVIVAVVFAVVYLAAMSIGAKKFDRYILPIFPVIALIAALGIDALLGWATSRFRRMPDLVRVGTVALVIAVQGYSMIQVLPYRLDYYTPLLGGPEGAQHVLQMGWGQGDREVVEFLDDQVPGDSRVVMQTSAVPSAFSYFMDDDSPISIEGFGMSTPAEWYETDYYVAGIQETQRDMASGYRILQRYEPVKTIDIGGVPYFMIYTPALLPLPDELQQATPCNADFGNGIRLMQIISRDSTIDLYWLSLQTDLPETMMVKVEFVAPDGTRQLSTAEWNPGDTGLMSRTRAGLPRIDDAALADYQLEITVFDATEQEPLAVNAHSDQIIGTTFTTESECFYGG